MTSGVVSAPCRGLSGPSGTKGQKSLENVSGPGTRKVAKKSREQGEKTLSTLSFRRLSGDFPDCSRDFLETFRGSPGRHFRDVFWHFGREGPRDLCKGRAGSQCLAEKSTVVGLLGEICQWRGVQEPYLKSTLGLACPLSLRSSVSPLSNPCGHSGQDPERHR